ncbi:dynein light chain Tctex-type 1-like [Sipha flava]|uniref:Dynein light chain Tctex-type 1-like n=1 Tax=Sipha flava TaxID=143950 RepID=A0A8B8FSB4_9HEMI|nr:dynein light chain Tctex-type 1-like [Sipha flava]
MGYLDEENHFDVNEVSDITKDSIEHTIGNQLYQRNMVNKWVNNVIDKSLMRLCQLAKPFKYMMICTILQKNGAGFYVASSCYWDNSTDRKCNVKWENESMYVILTIFGLAF